MHRRRNRTTARSVFALLAALVMTAGLALVVSPSAEATVTTPFAKRFGANTNGGIVLRGNSNLSCRTADAGCADARAGTAGNLNNDNYEMRYVNVDNDGTNFNSSSSTLTLSAGSTVLHAALYWSGDTESATNSQGGDAPIATPSLADRNKVRFKAPGGAYTTITAARFDNVTSVTGRDFYQGSANVTSLVAGAGNGTYTVGNIQATQNDSRYAGWALVVVYGNPADPVRNLTVFDGFGFINTANTPSLDIAVSGFETPPTGIVRSKIGTVVYEGDLGITGDALKLDGTTLSDAANPAANYFNSTLSDSGTLDTARNPAHRNLMAVDIDQFSTTTALANGATSATLNLSTAQDTFYPGVVTMATDLFAPDIKANLTAADANGGQLKPGDEIEYTIDARNQGNDGATDLVIADAVPTGTVYVPGSLRIDGVPRTDAAGDDAAEVQGGTGTFRLGSGADGTSGGSLAIGANTVVTFRVRVDPDTPGGTTITNVATITVKGESSNPPLSLTGASTVSNLTVTGALADLAVTGSVTPGTVQRDGVADPVGYDLTVVNNGPDAQPDTVLTLTLPAGVSFSSGTGCSAAGQVVTCAVGTVAVGATATAHVAASAAGSTADGALATAHVSGKYADSVPANDTATVALAVNRAPVAGADTGSTTHGAPVTRAVLGNDSDPDGDPLHVASAAANHGGVVVNGDNTVTYTPDAGFKGADTVTYTLADNRGGTTSGTLTVTVANAAPVAAPDAESTAALTPVTVNVVANDTDPNADGLTVTGVTQPAGGPATGTVVDNNDGTVTFTPHAAFGGTATFAYTVGDGDAGSATGTVTVTVANQGPAAAADSASTPYLTDVVVDVRANDTDPNGDPLTVTAVTTPVDGGGVQRGTAGTDGATVTYQPPAGFSGLVTFGYTVADGNGGTATATATVTVGNGRPVAGDDTATTPYHQSVVVDVLAGDSDPNGDPLTVSATGPAGHGVVTIEPDGTLRYAPDAGFSGEDTFTYTVSDGNGGDATATVTVTVLNAAPSAGDDARTIEADNPVTVPVLANDTDPNTTDDLVIDAFDGTSTEGGTVVQDDNGTPADPADDRLTYQPPANFLGVDSFTYTVGDGHGGSDLATVTITVQNTAPVARPDSDGTTPTNTAVTIPVLANDSDAGGDPLTVTATTHGGHGTVGIDGQAVTYTPADGFTGRDIFTYTVGDGRGGVDTAVVEVTVQNAPPVAGDDAVRVEPGRATVVDVLRGDTDANRHVLVVDSATDGAHGTVTPADDDLSVTYTPAPDYHGPDTFTYVVSDGNGGLDTGTVTVNVNAAPVPQDDNGVGTGTDTAVAINVLENDIDDERDPLTVTAGPAAPQHGTVAVQPDGSIVYTPATGYAGPDTFGYTVTDPSGGTGTATVSLVVANAAPVAGDDSGASTAPGAAVDVAVLLNDTDANVGAGGQSLTVTSVTQPAHGTAAIIAGGTEVRYTAGSHKGTDTFTYTVSDGHGGTDTATVTVVVDNTAPHAADDTEATEDGTPVEVDVRANDTDPNGAADTLTVTGVTQPRDAGGADRGTATTDGATVTYTPPAGFRGEVTFGYTVADADGLPAQATVTVDVANAPPVAADDQSTTPYQRAVTIMVLGNDTDPNGDDLTVTATAPPKAADGTVRGTVAIAANGTAVTYTPPAGFSGTVTFRHTVSDGFGGTATAVVTVDVAAAPAVPNKAVRSGPGDPITVSVPLVDDRGRPLTLLSTTRPKHGTARVNADGTVTYVPERGFAGRDSFRYTVEDVDGNRATGVINVRVAAAPKARNAAAKVARGGSITIAVLTRATDADGDKLTLKAVGSPKHGTVQINGDGTVTYVPDDGWTGADSFTYTVSDPDGNTSTGRVTVSVSGATTKLARTGTDVVSIATFGAAIVLAGAALLLMGARGARTPVVVSPVRRHRRR